MGTVIKMVQVIEELSFEQRRIDVKRTEMAAVGLRGRATAHPRLCALWMNAKGGSEGGWKPTKIRSMSHGAAVCWTCWPGVVIERLRGWHMTASLPFLDCLVLAGSFL